MPFKITVTQDKPGIFIISPMGEIDADTYSTFEKRVNSVLTMSPNIIIFNMEYLTFINSMGIGVILKAKITLGKNDGTLIMVNLQPQIKTVFEIIKALPDKDIFSSMEELDKYLKVIQQKDIEER